MDSTWPYNFDYNIPPTNTSQYYDKVIIPAIFYTAVMTRNVNAMNEIIKYDSKLCVSIATFYITTLANAFYTRKAAKYGAPVRITWQLQSTPPVIMNFNDQANLYLYVARLPWIRTNFGFLVNTINNYLITLRKALGLINNNYPANQYYKYGIDVTNNRQMKTYITYFIPGFIGPSVCSLLPKNSSYQLCSPWPQFGGLDNTNSRYTPILGSQTGNLNLLNNGSTILNSESSTKFFVASTSPVIAKDGTIYIGYNSIDKLDTSNLQGYLVAFYSDGYVKWIYKLINPDTSLFYVYFDSFTPAIGSDGIIYFGTTTNNIDYTGIGPVQSTSVYAIKPDGSLKWLKNFVPIGSPINPYNIIVFIQTSFIIGRDNTIYFGCSSYNNIGPYYLYSSLFSINSNNGTTNWEYPIESSESFITDSVAIDNSNNIYFSYIHSISSENIIYLISLTSKGEYRYKCNLNNGNNRYIHSNGRPILNINNSIVYAMSYFSQYDSDTGINLGNYYLYSINTQNGLQNLIQDIPFNNKIDSSYFKFYNNSLARDTNNNLYFSILTNNNAVLYCINNSLVKWTYTIDAPTGGYSLIDNTPSIGADGTIYFGVTISDGTTYSTSYMYAISSNKLLKWKKQIPSNLFSQISTSPVINSQGNIIISCNNSDSFDSFINPPNYNYTNLYSFNN